MSDNNEKMCQRIARDGNILPFITRSQKLAEDLMRVFNMSEGIIEAFKQGKVQRTTYVHYNKIIHSEVTDEDQEIIFDLLKQGQIVYHILLALDMKGKQLFFETEFPSYVFEELISKICYLCIPLDLYGEAINEEGFQGDTRQETVQNYIEDIIFEARQGILKAYVTDDSRTTLEFSQVEVTVVRGNLVLVTC
jgi:hypothetical protein